MKKIGLVIPTIRDLTEWIDAWLDQLEDVSVYIVEDKPHKTLKLPKEFKHYSWKEIDEELGKNSWIISRHNSGIRSYGFYKAWKDGCDIIITLDDDCFPITGNEIDMHCLLLEHKGCNSWFNTIKNGFPRGFPYSIRNEVQSVLNHGLWEGNLDLDAPTQMQNYKTYSLRDFQMVPKGIYFPMCIMNLSFKREIVPIMYQLLQGKGWEYDRFDDIWSGIIAKKIIDHLGFGVCSGSPRINHVRKSDVFENLIKESKGIKENETFFKKIDSIQLTEKDFVNCYKELWTKFKPHNDYFNKLKQAGLAWTNLFLS